MKKKKSDPPHDFVVEDADIAFGKLEDATRRLLKAKKAEASRAVVKTKQKSLHR